MRKVPGNKTAPSGFRQTLRKAMRAAAICVLLLLVSAPARSAGRHTFALGTDDFLLDGKPFQMISGEMHPARIPPAYWRHRIRMAKAMGVNTIAVYVFWNYHETEPGRFDFTTPGHDIAGFLKMAQEARRSPLP